MASSFPRSFPERAVQWCSFLTSRGSLFVVILLLPSDPDGLRCPALFSSALSPLHRGTATNVFLAACSSLVLGGSCPRLSPRRQCLYSGHCLRCRWVTHLNLMILRRRLEWVVASPILCPALFTSEAPTRDDRGHWPSSVCLSFLDPWSRVAQLRQLVSAAASRADPDESPSNRPSIPPGESPGTDTHDTPLFEVCSAKVRHRYFVLPSALLPRSEAPSPRESSFQHELSLPSGDHGTARIPSIRSAPHLSDSGTLLTFAERVLIASPCSVTIDASDDEFSMPTNTPGWNRGSHFPPLARLAGTHKIFSPNSRVSVLSIRPCSLCSGVFPSLPMSHLFIKYAASSTSQHSILAPGGTLVPMRCSNAALAWPATSPTVRSMIPLDWLSPVGELVRFPLPMLPVDDLRCSLRDPGKFRSFSWNQHRPCHLVSPFTDDQHKSHLFLRFPLAKEPPIH